MFGDGDNDEEEGLPCSICGKASCLSLDLGTDNPWDFCEDDMPEQWRAIFTTAKQPMGPCVICGGPGEVRHVDFTSTTVKHDCREHAPDKTLG
jgi:hypothetical protein